MGGEGEGEGEGEGSGKRKGRDQVFYSLIAAHCTTDRATHHYSLLTLLLQHLGLALSLTLQEDETKHSKTEKHRPV